MLFAPLIVIEQASWHVYRAGASGIAIWTEYEIGGARYTDLSVLVPERTLVPRDRIAHGIQTSIRGVARYEVATRLTDAGYKVDLA